MRHGKSFLHFVSLILSAIGAPCAFPQAPAPTSAALATPDFGSPPLTEDQLSVNRRFLEKFDLLYLKNPSRITLPLEFSGFAEESPFIPKNSPAETIDYHQHLFSPKASVRASLGTKGVDADTLVSELDAAGIQRAVVLSVAYGFSNPNKPALADEYAQVRAENDWTSAQVARFPQRLIGICSVNPLRAYALEEIARCATDKNLRTGLKLHFGNSDVNVDNPEHLNQLRLVFRAANQHGMAIIVHVHANIDHHRPYGAKEARIFLESLLPEAPDVTVQIAHLAGAGGYIDPAVDEALSVFVEAAERKDSRMKNVYFDASGIALPGMWEDKATLIVKRIRQIGVPRVLYGSDGAVAGNLPKEALERWHKLALTPEEFHTIENNVAPYLRRWLATVQEN